MSKNKAGKGKIVIVCIDLTFFKKGKLAPYSDNADFLGVNKYKEGFLSESIETKDADFSCVKQEFFRHFVCSPSMK